MQLQKEMQLRKEMKYSPATYKKGAASKNAVVKKDLKSKVVAKKWL